MTNYKKDSLQARLDHAKTLPKKDNSTIPISSSVEKALKSQEDEMIEFGIKKVPLNYFHFGQYRYTNLEDALIQARKEKLKLAVETL